MNNWETFIHDTWVVPGIIRVTVLVAQKASQSFSCSAAPPAHGQAGFRRPEVCASEPVGSHQLRTLTAASASEPECRLEGRKMG